MAAATVPGAFDPTIARRKLNGTLFYGLCLAAIGILLLFLLLLLVDILSRGLPWLDPQFLGGVPSRRPERAGVLPAQALDHATGHLAAALAMGALARQRTAESKA